MNIQDSMKVTLNRDLPILNNIPVEITVKQVTKEGLKDVWIIEYDNTSYKIAKPYSYTWNGLHIEEGDVLTVKLEYFKNNVGSPSARFHYLGDE